MKKVCFFIASVALAWGLTSCESGEHYCWEVQCEYSYKSDNNTRIEKKNSTTYEWNTKSGIDVEIKYIKEELVAEGCYDIKITKRKIDKSESDCDN
ncbi:MAG: hypothetical protein MSS84_02200 [Bacteroidales bacterium]|nr:hypothetical protein [Bacteroidales bacterium]